MKILLFLCLALSLSGCSTIAISDKTTGIDLKSTSFLTKAAIKSISVRDGDGKEAHSRMISGLQSDQVEAIQAMTELVNSTVAAGAKAAIK